MSDLSLFYYFINIKISLNTKLTVILRFITNFKFNFKIFYLALNIINNFRPRRIQNLKTILHSQIN